MATKTRRATSKRTTEPRERQAVVWTETEKKALKGFEKFKMNSTRFPDQGLLRTMGLFEDVSAFCDSIGLGVLTTMDAPTFEVPVRHLLATVTVDYKDPKEKRAQDGTLRFKVDDNEFALSIFDVCDAYGFAKKTQVQFPVLYAGNIVWQSIAEGFYSSHSAKTTLVRNPVLRYVCKLLANTFYARNETGAVKLDELCFIYQGIKGLLRDGGGDPIDDELGDNVNYGGLLATRLVSFRSWAKTAKKPHLWLGGFLTPLLAKAGVDLRRYSPNRDRNYIDRTYLIKNWFLKGGSDNVYKLYDASKKTRTFKLPNTARTTLLGLDNVEFRLREDEYIDAIVRDEDEQQQPAAEEDNQLDDETGDDLYGDTTDTLPEIDFTPKTKREKTVHLAYKVQMRINKVQRKINETHKKLIAKLFRKVKKLQPPNYVSSDDEDNDEAGEEMDDDPSHYTEEHEAGPSTSTHT